MLALQVNWTAPFAARFPQRDYALDPYELLTSIAAALFWRARGGRMVLCTDPAGLAFYRAIGLDEAYDEIDVTRIAAFERDVPLDPARAPCAARMHVLGSMTTPFVAFDLDCVLMDPGTFPYAAADFCCLHWELPIPPWYPPPVDQYLPDDFLLPSGLDFATLVPNIGFLYVGRPDRFQRYAALAVDYVRRAAAPPRMAIAPNIAAIFAEQRLLGMLAHADGLTFETLWNDLWTCGPHGDHWDALVRRERMADRLVAPFWVLDRARFDPRRETVECLHLWFEKPLYAADPREATRRRGRIEDLIARLRAACPSDPIVARLFAWLAASGGMPFVRFD